MNRCIVHDPEPADYDSRHHDGDFLPTLEDLEHDLYVHLQGLTGEGPECSVDYCLYCYEEYMIRTNGWDIEGVILDETAKDAHAMEECTCPEDSPNRWPFLKVIRHARFSEMAS